MIQDYKRIAEKNLQLLYRDPKISDKNKRDLKRYLQALEVTPARIGIIARHIKLLFYEMPDVVGSMGDRDLVNAAFKRLSKRAKPGYYETVKNVSKAFIRWHNDSETPRGWKDVKGNGRKAQRRDLSPEDMVTWEDGLRLASATNSVQIKAALLVQLDGGFRPSEFIELNYGDVSIKNSAFAVVRVKRGKTGKRDVILFRSVPYLQRWLKAHPVKEKDCPLWIQENGKRRFVRYRYDAIRWRVLDLGRTISFNKPLDFYNLRHSACYISKMDNTNAELAARKFGHSVDYYTNTYGRLSSDDDLKRYGKLYGQAEDKKELKDTPLACDKCGTVNEPGQVYCEQCNSPLTMEAAMKRATEADEMRGTIEILKSRLNEFEKYLKAFGMMKEKGLTQ